MGLQMGVLVNVLHLVDGSCDLSNYLNVVLVCWLNQLCMLKGVFLGEYRMLVLIRCVEANVCMTGEENDKGSNDEMSSGLFWRIL